jgi:hypothetical protein
MGEQLTAEGYRVMAWLIVAGIVVLGLTATVFGYFCPRKGQTHPWVTLPILDSVIPLALLSGVAFGGALLLSGIIGS